MPRGNRGALCLLLREGKGLGLQPALPCTETQNIWGWKGPQKGLIPTPAPCFGGCHCLDGAVRAPSHLALSHPAGSHQGLGGLGELEGWAGGAEGCGGSDLPSKHISALHLSQCHAGSSLSASARPCPKITPGDEVQEPTVAS